MRKAGLSKCSFPFAADASSSFDAGLARRGNVANYEKGI